MDKSVKRGDNLYLTTGLILSIVGLIIDGISLIIPMLLFLGAFLTFFGLPLVSNYLGTYYRRSHDIAGIILMIIYVLIVTGLLTVSTTKLISQIGTGTEGISVKDVITSEVSNTAYAIIGSIMLILTYLVSARDIALSVIILRAFNIAVFAVFVISIIVGTITHSLISFIALIALVITTIMYIEFVKGLRVGR
mgnify:CR=1 FL=1